MLPGRRLTLLIIPKEGGSTHEYKVPRLLLWLGSLLTLGVVVLLGVGGSSWIENDYLARRVERLERDKAILANEVELIEELEVMLVALEQSNLKLRNMAAEAVGLNTRGAPRRSSRTREKFISIHRRLQQGGLRTVPTLAPVVLSAWRELDKGVLLHAAKGSVVKASAAGRVERIHYDQSLGYNILIHHGNGLQTSYSGLGTLIASAGTFVQKGQPLGLLGWPRNGATPGVRFAIIENSLERTKDFRNLWL
jgi:murein DD-endopeptidase MepM/ murein hydrolase activator NlpD